MVEEEELLSFLDAYKEVVEDHLSYSFGRNERPDPSVAGQTGHRSALN